MSDTHDDAPYRDNPFGRAFHLLRLEEEVSMQVVAKVLGITSEYVSGVEWGRYAPPATPEARQRWIDAISGGMDELERAERGIEKRRERLA